MSSCEKHIDDFHKILSELTLDLPNSVKRVESGSSVSASCLLGVRHRLLLEDVVPVG